MIVWTVLTSFGPNDGKRKKEEHLALQDLSALPQVKTCPIGFAAGKN